MIDELQKIVLNCLNNQTSENFKQLSGIFNYIDKNQKFPYIFYFINNIEDLSTYSKKIYSCDISINVYSKNQSSIYIVKMLEEIKNIFININNFSSDKISIIDILINKSDIILEENNSIWRGEITFKIIFSY